MTSSRTPAIDALAAESVDFTQAVTPHPFGPFARAALLTGHESTEEKARDRLAYDELLANSLADKAKLMQIHEKASLYILIDIGT